jgi:hypothetical protein
MPVKKKTLDRRDFLKTCAWGAAVINVLSPKNLASGIAESPYDAKGLPTVIYGKTGARVPRMAVGLGSRFCAVQDPEKSQDLLNYALDKGINTIVTNTAYRRAEDMLYQAIGNRRDEFNLSIGTDYRTRRLAEKDINNSLNKFHTDFIDIYQMSGVRRLDAVKRAVRPDGALQALLEAKKNGKIGHIGIASHNHEAAIKAIKTGHVECCQFAFNMANTQALKDIIPIAQEHDVDLFVMRPLESGWFDNQAEKALRFVLSSPVDVVISGMYTKEIIDANVVIAEEEPIEEELQNLLKEAETISESKCKACHLCRGHWIDMDGAACPQGINIYDLLAVRNFRARYGLSTEQEKRYLSAVKEIEKCNKCLQCEALCIFNVPILSLLHEIEQECSSS